MNQIQSQLKCDLRTSPCFGNMSRPLSVSLPLWCHSRKISLQRTFFKKHWLSLLDKRWQFHHYYFLYYYSVNSKKTPFRRWSCVTTSPCSAFIKRRSLSSSTFRSHPTFWGPLLTPRSKDTERWGWMSGNHFSTVPSVPLQEGQISFL